MTLFRLFLTGLIALCVLTLLLHTYLLRMPKDSDNSVFTSSFFVKKGHEKLANEIIYDKFVAKDLPQFDGVKSADAANRLVEVEQENIRKELVDRYGKRFLSIKQAPSTTSISFEEHPLEDQLGRVRDATELHQRALGFQQHAFNVLVSDRIGFHRQLPDTRNSFCADQQYLDTLPRVSIIICFYNEALSTLLRTVFSILDRTNSTLLQEILLIDDFSTGMILCN